MPDGDKHVCRYLNLGSIDYDKAYHCQRHLVDAVIAESSDEHLLFLEHPPVLTIGRGGGRHNILADDDLLQREGIAVREIDRGGDVTYHGPGQLVGYPILNLNHHGRDIHLYLRHLEEALIRMLADFGLKGERSPGLTGVWVGGAKVAAIGVGARRWVTFHGFALNIDPDMDHFKLINPCGITDKPVIAMKDLLGKVDPVLVRERTLLAIAEVFNLDIVPVCPGEVEAFVTLS
ncbi:MAG: lipoyl(octanoyl) transferase LipB [bacterium]|jgi:lipoyl(octanoyl) transferase|nr:lipoyl(octanoyl) transferase LipB [bacterium]MDD3805214.1 lipoyl(octanoyl) transferase LipB [bacterium]MDD4152923.1 lipoyl(octanoyl) transferase LipB [bacterium]MDD4558625.1 lipoyl(octanoyl) transferase LipB [bacterium]